MQGERKVEQGKSVSIRGNKVGKKLFAKQEIKIKFLSEMTKND